jgi:hypothetical protein
MPAVVILIYACLAASPDRCQTERLSPMQCYGDAEMPECRPISGVECAMRGQIPVAAWLADHPGYALARDPRSGRTGWSCVVADGRRGA